MRCWRGGLVGNGGANSLGRYEYIWLPTEDGGAMPIGLYKDGKFFAVHADHLGTPRLITDNTSKPIWQWPYSAFGESSPTGVLALTSNTNLIYTQDPSSLNRLKLTTPGVVYNLRHEGQYADAETGLFYNYFRTYDPKTGRYSQNDPIGLNGGLNRFGYVGGNALSFVDPLGLSPSDVQKIYDTFNGTVNSMTGGGSRNPNPYLNNLSSSLNRLTGGAAGKPYLGCADQEAVTRDQLQKRVYEDTWTFTQQSNLVHRWGEARSSNPSDPVIIYDPWRGTINTKP